jgi:hypothetical protein
MQQPKSNRALEHFQTVVEPTALEFLEAEHLGSVRHGYQAAIMLAHMAEHFFEAGLAGSSAKNAPAYYKRLADSDEDFAPLADVCDASKHATLWPVVAGRNRPFTSSENVKAGPILANSSRPANSSLPVNQTVLSVTFDRGPKAGTHRELDLAVRKVLAYWRRELRLPAQPLVPAALW